MGKVTFWLLLLIFVKKVLVFKLEVLLLNSRPANVDHEMIRSPKISEFWVDSIA